MAKRKRRAGSRQIITTPSTFVPTEANFPIIATEVFWELNPELHTFLESKPPQYYPSPYPYGTYPIYGNPKKNTSWGCAPRRSCVPRPCAPV